MMSDGVSGAGDGVTPVRTPGQTVGPFFHLGLRYGGDSELVAPGHRDAVQLNGRVLDGDGAGVPDALVEIWQLQPDGSVAREPGSLRRDGATFTGFGRAATDPDGRYRFTTLRPGAAAGSAPFFAVTVFARGLLDRLVTRAYLPGSPELATDSLLAGLGAQRRASLVAAEDADGWRFDIVLQGADETVFLAHQAPG